jgi:hypothetical protein
MRQIPDLPNMSFFPPFLIPLQLAEKLENSEWTSQFLAQEGAISLMECILFCIFKMKYVSYFLYACFKKIFFFFVLFSSRLSPKFDHWERSR